MAKIQQWLINMGGKGFDTANIIIFKVYGTEGKHMELNRSSTFCEPDIFVEIAL